MTKTEYLYNIHPTKLMQLNYFDAITLKYNLAKELIAELYEEPMDTRDEDRIFAIHKAISFNKKLLEELK